MCIRDSTAKAFEKLGLPPEPRTFSEYVKALSSIHKSPKIIFGSNNPQKIAALENAGYIVTERKKLDVHLTPDRKEYLKSKTAALGHLKDEK